MITILIAGAVGALVFAGYKRVRECTSCRKRLKYTCNCLICDDALCDSCFIEMPEVVRDGVKLRCSGIACPESCEHEVNDNDGALISRHDAERGRGLISPNRLQNVRLVSASFEGQQYSRVLVSNQDGIRKINAEGRALQIAAD